MSVYILLKALSGAFVDDDTKLNVSNEGDVRFASLHDAVNVLPCSMGQWKKKKKKKITLRLTLKMIPTFDETL